LRPGKKRKEFKKPDDKRNSRSASRPSRSKKSTEDVVTGRNSVVEALRAKIPAKELLIAARANYRIYSLG